MCVWLRRCRCCCCCDAGAVTLYATGIPVVVAGGAVVAAAAVVALAVDVEISVVVAVVVALMLLLLQPLPLLRLLPLLLVLGYVAGADQHPNVVVASVADDSPVHHRPPKRALATNLKGLGDAKMAGAFVQSSWIWSPWPGGKSWTAYLADPRPRPPRSPCVNVARDMAMA